MQDTVLLSFSHQHPLSPFSHLILNSRHKWRRRKLIFFLEQKKWFCSGRAGSSCQVVVVLLLFMVEPVSFQEQQEEQQTSSSSSSFVVYLCCTRRGIHEMQFVVCFCLWEASRRKAETSVAPSSSKACVHVHKNIFLNETTNSVEDRWGK